MTITKKWKCASVEPRAWCTSTADEVSSPIATMQARKRMLRLFIAAATPNTAIGKTSMPDVPERIALRQAEDGEPDDVRQTSATITRWRRCQTSAGRVLPRGRLSRTRCSVSMPYMSASRTSA